MTNFKGPRPSLITFDIFGTVLNWRAGLSDACAKAGRPLQPGEFDRVVDLQGELERESFRKYSEITKLSLTRGLGLPEAEAARIGEGVGDWPFYEDSAAALRALMKKAPCAAMTNSDLAHGTRIQERLGFGLSAWLCAEQARVYKPDPGFWRLMAELRGVEPGPAWWHVSAYADYDLGVAGALGLTTVFVERPHARPGPASHKVPDLAALAALLA